MKRVIHNFLQRGLMAGGFGPIIIAIIYFCLEKNQIIQTVSIEEICLAIFSSAALAFVAGGINVIYQIERLPLMVAILIHCLVLYFAYLGIYLINGWLKWGVTPILIFSIIFLLGYLAIWGIIYATNKRRTAKLNKFLQKQHHAEDTIL